VVGKDEKRIEEGIGKVESGNKKFRR